jgi:hypothetical protein
MYMVINVMMRLSRAQRVIIVVFILIFGRKLLAAICTSVYLQLCLYLFSGFLPATRRPTQQGKDVEAMKIRIVLTISLRRVTGLF